VRARVCSCMRPCKSVNGQSVWKNTNGRFFLFFGPVRFAVYIYIYIVCTSCFEEQRIKEGTRRFASNFDLMLGRGREREIEKQAEKIRYLTPQAWSPFCSSLFPHNEAKWRGKPFE
jgi:hypothetical protein